MTIHNGNRCLAAITMVTFLACTCQAEEDILRETVTEGPVSAEVRLKPAKPLIGDAVELTIRVVAENDVELLMPEFGEALDRFTVLDFVPRRELDSDGRSIAVQRYRLQPPMSGEHAIPPILIEFVDRRPGKKPAPNGQDAYELLTPRLEFQVQSILPDDATAELKSPLGRLEPRVSTVRRWWPFLMCLVIVAALSPWLWKRYQRNRQLALRRSAYEIAQNRLNRLLLRRLPQGKKVDAFYVELSDVVRTYLENRFDMRAPELTTEEFLESVSDSPDLTRDHQTLLRQFLRQADLVKFAGVQPGEDIIRRSLDAAQQFLNETRENAPLVDGTDRRHDKEETAASV